MNAGLSVLNTRCTPIGARLRSMLNRPMTSATRFSCPTPLWCARRQCAVKLPSCLNSVSALLDMSGAVPAMARPSALDALMDWPVVVLCLVPVGARTGLISSESGADLDLGAACAGPAIWFRFC